MKSSCLFIITFAIFLATCPGNCAISKIKIPIIHRDSQLSPFHKANLLSNDIKAPILSAKKYIFLINISIGDPPVPQLLLLDGGSSFVWACTTKCSYSTYNPANSATYEPIRCSYRQECFNNYSRGYECMYYNSFENLCTYQLIYGDVSYRTISEGFLVREKLTFDSTDGGKLAVPRAVIGQEYRTLLARDGAQKMGIFGLEPIASDTLTSRLGNKYSYCLGNISDLSYMYNHLILGEGANIGENNLTPLKRVGDHFLVNFQGIRVEDTEDLEIDNSELGYNTLIDSGTTYTLLQKGVYAKLRERIEDIMWDGFQDVDQSKSSGDLLCYKGNLVRDLAGFPTISIRFADDSDLYLLAESLFVQINNKDFCLAFRQAKDPFNIIGAYAQQGHNFGFDMVNMQVTFELAECDAV